MPTTTARCQHNGRPTAAGRTRRRGPSARRRPAGRPGARRGRHHRHHRDADRFERHQQPGLHVRRVRVGLLAHSRRQYVGAVAADGRRVGGARPVARGRPGQAQTRPTGGRRRRTRPGHGQRVRAAVVGVLPRRPSRRMAQPGTQIAPPERRQRTAFDARVRKAFEKSSPASHPPRRFRRTRFLPFLPGRY